MADLSRHFDGHWTLAQTENACEAEQQSGGYQLQRISGTELADHEEVRLVNRADFTSKLPIGGLERLLFVLVGAHDPAALKSQKESEGWTYICDSRIYVEGVLERVMVFGKK